MKNKIKIAASILTLSICLMLHPFLIVNAASNHFHQTFTGGRVEWEANTYGTVQDINIDGTTFRAGGIILANVYLNNTSTGTIRLYWSGFNQGWYNAMNVYVYGASISNIGYSGTNSGITLKLNNPTDNIKVIISFNDTGMNSSIESLTAMIISPSLTAASSEATTVQDIDVKLAGIDTTLSQILAIIGSGSTSITDYLNDIDAYSVYLKDLYDNIDDIIDTISWVDNGTSYKGWTSDYSTFNTATYGYLDPGYYVLENPTFVNNNVIYKLTIGIGINSLTFDNIRLYQYWENDFREFTVDSYLFVPTRYQFVLYFTVNERYHTWPQSTYPLCVYVNKRMYKYSTQPMKLETISDTDIEYWTLYNAIKQNKIIDILNNLSVGDSSTTTQQNIENKTQELELQLQDSNQAQQGIENMIDDFNLQFDLDDYRFDIGNQHFVQYFKLRLTDIYNINDFKPFYIVPIVLFIVWRLLSG